MHVDAFQALLHLALVTPGESSHLEIFQDGEFGKKFSALGHMGNAHADNLLGWTTGNRLAHKGDGALSWGREARNRLEGGGFAGAIGTEEGDDRAFRHFKGNALERLNVAVKRLDLPHYQ